LDKAFFLSKFDFKCFNYHVVTTPARFTTTSLLQWNQHVTVCNGYHKFGFFGNDRQADEPEKIEGRTFRNINILGNLTFRGTCIMIYSYNERQQATLFFTEIKLRNNSYCWLLL